MKKVLIAVGVVTVVIPLLGYLAIVFTFTFLLPSRPDPAIYLSNNLKEWQTQFSCNNKDSWKIVNNQLVFKNNASKIQRISLQTKDIPSENKKPGRLNGSVTLGTYLPSIAPNSFYGLEIGDPNLPLEKHVIFGINGAGEMIVKNGLGESLNNVELNPNCDLNNPSKNGYTLDAKLKFELMRNKYGWLLYFYLVDTKDEDKAITCASFINKIPKEWLSNENKEISIVAYNTEPTNSIWFKNLEIRNDWIEND